MTRDEQHIQSIVRGELARSKQADPHVIARRLIGRLSADVRETLVYRGLLDVVCKEIRFDRVGGVRPPSRTAGPSKWAVLRVCPGGEWKLLDDCGEMDLVALISQHEEISRRNLARRDEYQTLLDALRASGCETVGELWKQQQGLAA